MHHECGKARPGSEEFSSVLDWLMGLFLPQLRGSKLLIHAHDRA